MHTGVAGSVVNLALLWGAPKELILTNLYLLAPNKHWGRHKGEWPTVALPVSCWQGMQSPGQDATSAAWRKRGNRTITWITGSFPVQCQLGLH